MSITKHSILHQKKQMFYIENKVSSGRKTPYSDGKEALLISKKEVLLIIK